MVGLLIGNRYRMPIAHIVACEYQGPTFPDVLGRVFIVGCLMQNHTFIFYK